MKPAIWKKWGSCYFVLFVVSTSVIDSSSQAHVKSIENEPCSSLPQPLPSTREKSKLDLFNLLSKGSEFTENCPDIDYAVFMLGNTGAGKSTVTQIIAADLSQLHAVKTPGEDLIIIDENNLIGLPSTTSKTLVPEVVLKPGKDENTEPLTFFDFPGFDDTRGPDHDIAANYFINQITTKTRNAKMLFLFTPSPIKINTRDEFDKMVMHATTFVKNISKYDNSFGLLVNRVVTYNNKGKYISDHTIMNEILEFIEDYNQTLHSNLESANPDDKTEILRKISFVKPLLDLDPTTRNHTRIWFVRSPIECGRLNTSKIYQETRDIITKFYERLEYTRVDAVTDFAFTVKAETRESIVNFTRTINSHISYSVSKLTKNFETQYFEDFSANIRDLNLSALIKSTRRDSLSLKAFLEKISTENINNAFQFVTSAQKLWKDFAVLLPGDFEDFVRIQENYLKFFDLASGTLQERNVKDWSEPIQDLSSTIYEHSIWFGFCGDIQKILSGYEFQSKKPQLDQFPTDSENWLQFIVSNNITVVPGNIQDLAPRISKSSRMILNKLINFAFTVPSIYCDSKYKRLIIHGNFILFENDVIKHQKGVRNCQDATQVVIFAAHTIFFDANLTLINLDAVLLAPIWVKPNKNDGHMFLVGKDGINAYQISGSPGRDRTAETGNPGCSGKPGGPGGTMFGISSHTQVSSKISIISIGGIGGKGQDGGAGGNAPHAKDANLPEGIDGYWNINWYGENAHETSLGWGRWDYHHNGHDGPKGGTGGNGGVGGAGGISKSPVVIQLLNKDNVYTSFNTGEKGLAGNGGIGGIGGHPGKGFKCKHQIGLYLRCSTIDVTLGMVIEGTWRSGPQGDNGLDGVSTTCSSVLTQPRKISAPSQILLYKSLFFQESNPTTLQFIQEIDINIETKQYFPLAVLASESEILDKFSKNKSVSKRRLKIGYNSLVSRLEAHTRENPDLTSEHKKVVSLLICLCRSAIIHLEEDLNANAVVDVTAYFKIIKSEIISLKTVNAFVAIQKSQENFSNKLQKKINQTTHLIKEVVVPSIHQAGVGIASKLDLFQKELDQMVANTAYTIDECKKMLKKAETKHIILSVIKIYTDVQKIAASFVPVVGPILRRGLNIVTEPLQKKYNNQPKKIEKLKVLIKEANAMMNQLAPITKTFENQFTPLLNSLFVHFKNVSDSLASGKNVGSPQLGLKKWEVTRRIMECSKVLEELTVSSLTPRPLINALRRLQDAMTISIDLYEMIEHYIETQSLGKYISTVNLAALSEIPITDPKLATAIGNFDQRLKKQILKGETIKALHAFKQWVFPFAKFYLPEDTKMVARAPHGNEEFGDTELHQIEYLSLQLDKYKAMTVDGQDTHIIQTNFSSGLKTSKPFFTWKNREWREDIRALLSGSKVNLPADVSSQGFYNWEAIKFKLIEINLKLTGASAQLQEEFDGLLPYFGISMTHSGISNYRFQKEYFVMTGSSQTITYNFERDVNGDRLGTNVVYKKFKEGDYISSPFTVWTIELKNVVPRNVQRYATHVGNEVSLKDLTKFLPYMDVELIGIGTYVDGVKALKAANGDLKLHQWYKRNDISRARIDFQN